MECKLKSFFQKSVSGITLVEVMVVLILLSLSFLVFLQALNTGKTVRVRSELRTVQAVLLNSLEQEIRARRFDENTSSPWSAALGTDGNEISVALWDDIDDFHQYAQLSLQENPAFGCSVAVQYVDAASAFHQFQNSQTDYKSVLVKITHPTLSALTDTMVISSGL